MLPTTAAVALQALLAGEGIMGRLWCASGVATVARQCQWAPARRWFSRSTVRSSAAAKLGEPISVDGKQYQRDDWTNTPSSILSYIPRRLHTQPNHPISITRQLIESRFPKPKTPGRCHEFKIFNSISPVVTVAQNFDSLNFPPDHPGRSRTDTYYINRDTVLRTHTSAHEAELFAANKSEGWLLSADVYRRDAIDKSHYPVFHQMEGALTWEMPELPNEVALEPIVMDDITRILHNDITVEDPSPTVHRERNPLQPEHDLYDVNAIVIHLKRTLEDVVWAIFSHARDAAVAAGDKAAAEAGPLKVRWVESYFPHTSPSWEMEVFWQGDWLEVLGCGVIKQDILKRAGVPNHMGWAFGLGLERIAMLLFEIPDIRLFWSQDKRFLDQFKGVKSRLVQSGKLGYLEKKFDIKRFVPFSKYPECYKDVSFFLPTPSSGISAAGGQLRPTSATTFHENDLMELVREVAGDLVEDVRLTDEFTHPKSGKRSLCYRINYRSLERTMTNEEANALHEKVREQLVARWGVELR